MNKPEEYKGKLFVKLFLISLPFIFGFYIWFWGNFNLFGEQGFHLTKDDIPVILIFWAIPTSVIFSIIIMIIDALFNLSDKINHKEDSNE